MTEPIKHNITGAQRLYRVPEAMRLLAMSRSTFYEEIRSGRLKSVKRGGKRLVTDTAINHHIALLEKEAEEQI